MARRKLDIRLHIANAGTPAKEVSIDDPRLPLCSR
jgi:hypothetical protein